LGSSITLARFTLMGTLSHSSFKPWGNTSGFQLNHEHEINQASEQSHAQKLTKGKIAYDAMIHQALVNIHAQEGIANYTTRLC
jgi:hypothetical protein